LMRLAMAHPRPRRRARTGGAPIAPRRQIAHRKPLGSRMTDRRTLPDLPDLPGILVAPSWVQAHVGHPRLRLVDLRDGEAWAEGHIPGATQLDLPRLGSSRDGCDNVLLGGEDFADLMAELGVSDEDTVVAYDDQWGLAASRLTWALHRYGHACAGVLDGGWDRWGEEGGSTTTMEPAPVTGRFEVRPSGDVYADLRLVQQIVAGRSGTLLDTRTKAEYDQGHLPGAESWDWFTAVPPGSWDCSRPVPELLAEWADLGLDPSGEVVVYCRSGMRAAHTYVTLRHAGFAKVRLYDGSWQEWSRKAEELNGD
jgi:3-mercaptopyruvate sulfurtransferase SseA